MSLNVVVVDADVVAVATAAADMVPTTSTLSLRASSLACMFSSILVVNRLFKQLRT